MTSKNNSRLPLTFHMTFKPELDYLSALLRYAATGKEGDIEEISAATGIPNGASSGKVLPTIRYCTGMGLLCAQKKGTRYTFSLTPFGRAVFNEDKYLKEPVTQWLAHLNLCHPNRGADLWYQIFVEGADALGETFSRQSLEVFLRSVYATAGRNPIGPVISMYTDEMSFGKIGVLRVDGDQINRLPAPHAIENRRGNSAWLAQLLADFFPGGHDILITEWEHVCGWKKAAGWSPSITADVLLEAERLGFLSIDRHMQPWLITLQCSPDSIWRTIYDEIL